MNMPYPFYIDDNRLLQLGFNNNEINNMHYIQNNGGKFTPQALQSYGYTPEQASRLMYIYRICIGKVQINTKQEMITHLRKLFGSSHRISIQDLAISTLNKVPRVAVVAGLNTSPYNIWNSNQYKGTNALYKVVDVTGQKITVETSRKPKLEYGSAKKLPGQLEIKGVKANGEAIVTFDKNYCALCNRFIIIASLRNPEFHLGKYEIICFEGTKVYVYAINMGIKENIRYSGGTQRVYDFGIYPNTIHNKLTNVAKRICQSLYGVSTEYFPPTTNYEVITRQKNDNMDDEVVL